MGYRVVLVDLDLGSSNVQHPNLGVPPQAWA